jgi:ferredoxin
MLGKLNNAFAASNDHSECSGCSLCLLVCPVWRKTRDISQTPHGRAKALQHGGQVGDASIESCTLCLACEPVCPEKIDPVGMILELRRKKKLTSASLNPQSVMKVPTAHSGKSQKSPSTILLPDSALRARAESLVRVAGLLGSVNNVCVGEDDGTDISLLLESSAEISTQRLENFIASLRQHENIIACNGLLLRQLKSWLPKANVIGLGEALSKLSVVRNGLRNTDLYVIETRAYHSDYERLVKHYDRIRIDHGCDFNLDLQRIAIPATARSLSQRLGTKAADDEAQARWLLLGRKITRIVVESIEECASLEKASALPVVYLADLAVGQ